MYEIIQWKKKNSYDIFLFQNVVGLLIADQLHESVALKILWHQMVAGWSMKLLPMYWFYL